MASARRFLAVPTSALLVDADVAKDSSHGYSERDLQEIAATVPAVYDRIADGWLPSDFAKARFSQDPKQQQLGETYTKLFEDTPTSAPLAASYNGTDLVVDKGNHRVRAARSIDVPVLPVWVHAPTEADLDRVDNACARRIEREGATQYREAHELHESSREVERTVFRDRAREPEGRERDTSGPELWR